MEANLKKYYQPGISEFHVGFEYYVNNKKEIFKVESSFLLELFEDWILKDIIEVRIKYLDKKDIESLGWRFIGGKLLKDSYDYFENDKYFLHYLYKKQKLIITNKLEYPHKSYTYFDGTIKNKSELVKLMKQLNIK